MNLNVKNIPPFSNNYIDSLPDAPSHPFETPDLVEEAEATIPHPLCGVPLLEDLFRKNRDRSSLQNDFLMRILAHESVLYRSVMEGKRRVRRLSKFMDRERKLQSNQINRAWMMELSNLLFSSSFEFAPEQYLSFKLESGKPIRLAVPSPRDEIILDSMRLILDAIYEPRFSTFSFGFRPDRGRQVALRNIKNHIRGTDYYITVELSQALQQMRGFELIQSGCKQIHDSQFEQLMYKALDIGYVNTFGMRTESFVAVPRESGITPILVNCHLDALDTWLGIYKSAYSDYKKPMTWPISDPMTPPDYRRLRFVRCGSSLFLGVRGSFAEARCIARDIKEKLVELSINASLVEMDIKHSFSHSNTGQRIHFLGYDISRETPLENAPSTVAKASQFQTRPLFYIPTFRLRDIFEENGFIKYSKVRSWIPFGNGSITHWPVEHIVRYFDRLTVGLLEYYALADNFRQLHWFVYVLKRSCNLTIGRKLKLRSMRKVFLKYGRDLVIKDGDTVVATLPDRSLSVRPLVRDFYPELTPYLRRRRFITRKENPNNAPDDDSLSS